MKHGINNHFTPDSPQITAHSDSSPRSTKINVKIFSVIGNSHYRRRSITRTRLSAAVCTRSTGTAANPRFRPLPAPESYFRPKCFKAKARKVSSAGL